MENTEYDRCDAEIIDMVNRNRYCYPAREKLRLMTEAQATALLKRQEPENKIFEKPEAARQKLILQLCHVLVPVGIAMAWVLAAIEGLADPAFTSIITGACGMWGCLEWKWGKANAGF